ncbi:hypothetical protein CCR95_06760 [Thiocystis minor]|uniref:response regulator n=1 Tax=Thiocystis minor TaxID=61597 RepID=UPI001911C187|nr:response regulator [Thiocystis minor]MBK5963791.1 hypothetical protein [Thiocystis minor]
MAATESREFTVAPCGFPDSDQKALGRAFMLAGVRPKRYLFWTASRQQPDVCLVNEDQPEGVLEWTALRERFPEAPIPVLRVGALARDETLFEQVTSTFFQRPILANRVLKALDAFVSEVYRFAPELAIHDDMQVQSPQQEDAGDVSPNKTSSKKILVVDDSESVRKMMAMQLVKMGYSVEFAETGENALTKAREQIYDLIFLDVMLPGINGYDVSRHLKRNLRIPTPVVMLTGRTSRMDKLRGTLASADAYLTKPLTLDQLNETLQRFLR